MYYCLLDFSTVTSMEDTENYSNRRVLVLSNKSKDSRAYNIHVWSVSEGLSLSFAFSNIVVV